MGPRKLFQYSETDMENAIEECKQGSPIATAAKKFGVPRITLLNKVSGKTPIKRKMGRTCYVTDEVENILVAWAKAMFKQGFPIGKDNLIDSVKKIVDDLNVETPFKNGRPGKSWYKSFLKRHPDLITRKSRYSPASKACETAPQLEYWFKEVSRYLNNNNFSEILNKPRRIFIMDELAFFVNPKGNKVLATKIEHAAYQKRDTEKKEYYTVLLGGNAVGEVLPPMVIFKYARIPKELRKSVPETWSIGQSDSGWMTTETFYEYICMIFNKWLDDNNVPKPILLFMNGHTSHMSFHASKFCSENGIVLIALHPNATHLLHPMDVTVFKRLKSAWKAAVHSRRLENIDSTNFHKINFCPLLNKVLQDTLTPEIFEAGFRKCGLVPWNHQERCLLLTPPISKSIELTHLQKIAKIKELELGKHFLDKYIDTEKIIKEDIGLLEFYNKVEESLNKLKVEVMKDQNSVVEPSEANILSMTTLTDDLKIPLDLPRNNVTNVKRMQITETINDNSPDVTLDYITGEFKTPIKLTENDVSQTKEKDTTMKHFSNNMKMIIQSPFKRAWSRSTPKETETNNKKKKLSSVISSVQCERYYKNNKKKKYESAKEKKRKLKETIRKKNQIRNVQALKRSPKLDKECQMAEKEETQNIEYIHEIYIEEEWLESEDSIVEVSDEQ